MVKKLPFAPLPPRVMSGLAKRFMSLGSGISKGLPNLKEDLFQADIEMHPREYVTYAIITAIFYAVFIFVVIFALSIILRLELLFLAVIMGIVFYVFMFISALFYPKIRARRRMREVELNLIPSLRHLLIEIKSGVPLFQAMNAVSEGYGETSKEFSRIVRDINTGTKEPDAITDATRRNPSFQFRRALWQISNALRAGSDLGDAMEAIVEDLTSEQITAIRRYGQELNPWTMIYMVAAVIIPSLGITFLVVITSFTGAIIPNLIFPVILVALLGFQLFFMNFIKSKRPAV